jgi:endonuclease IV
MQGNFGLKLWSTNTQLLELAEDVIKKNLFQYIELSVVPETDLSLFVLYNLPCCIHITTDLHGVNIASPLDLAFTTNQIRICIDWADALNAKKLILHPGVGNLNDALQFLKNLDDDRILIENMPRSGIHGENMVGFSPEEIELLIGEHFGFCLDLNHAIKAAADLHVPYERYIREFLRLKPALFHISDGHRDNGIDEHLAIGTGDYNIPQLLNFIRDSGSFSVTLETPRGDLQSLSEDLINLNTIKQFNIL